MSFFYDLNKKLDSIREKPEVTHKQLNERDEGKPGKMFDKIAKDAGERYGSKAAGKRVAGAVRNKLKDQGKLEERDQVGPSAITPDREYYKTPNFDQYGNTPGALGAWAQDARGQNKYVDRTAPGVINKIKDKLGYDMPDPAYGPRPDERERLAKRYPAPGKEGDVDESAFQAAIGKKKYGADGMKALQKAGREGKALDPVRKKYDKYDEGQNFGPGRQGPNKNQAGPNSFNPDSANYKTPNLDQMNDIKQRWEKDTGKPQGYDGFNGAADMDARGQNKYVDRTAPGIVNKIKDKLGYDMPDPAYGPRPDETQRLAKRYPKPANESGGPAAAKPVKTAPAPTKAPAKPAPKDNGMGRIVQGTWQADPKGKVPAPSGDPEGVPESSAPMTAKQRSFAKLAPPANKITFADKIAGAKKEVDEMLGDVAAEAMRNALSPKQKKIDMNKNGKLDANDFAMLRKGAKPEMDEDNAFDYKSPRQGSPKVGSVERGHKHDIKHTATGRMVTRRTDDQGHSVGADDEADAGPRGRGRPKGTKNVSSKAKVFQRKSKLMTKESDVDVTDQGEYDQEGDMAKNDIKTIVRHAQALSRVLGDNDNLPEWVQSKLAKIEGMMISVDEYMQNQSGEDDEEEAIAEEPRSKNQAVAARIARGVQKGTAKAKPGSASAEMAKMQPKELNKFAKGSTKGLPKKVSKNKAVDEADENSDDGKLITKQTGPGQSLTTSTTGRVSATLDKGKVNVKPGKSTDDDADTASVSDKNTSSTKSNSMVGKGIYDSMNRELELMIAESMSVNMSDSTEGNKSLTVTATDDDAMKLAMILKSAGLGGHGGDMHSHGEEACDTCGMQDCGCGDVQEAVDENAPDWPTNTEQADSNFGYSGGLNKPKSSGMATGSVTDVSMDDNDPFRQQVQRMREMAGIQNEDNIDLGPTSPEVAAMSNDEVNAALRLDMSPDISGMDPDEVNAQFGDGNDTQYEDSIQRMREMAGIREAKKAVDEEKTEEGNLFTKGLEDDDVKIGDKIPGTNAIKKKDIDESIFALTNQWRAYKG